MCHPLVSLALVVAMATPLANAQVVSGRVIGFVGEPAACAVVEMYGESSGGFQVLTGPDGRFERLCDGKVVLLRVQHEGVVVTVPFADGKTSDLGGDPRRPGGDRDPRAVAKCVRGGFSPQTIGVRKSGSVSMPPALPYPTRTTRPARHVL